VGDVVKFETFDGKLNTKVARQDFDASLHDHRNLPRVGHHSSKFKDRLVSVKSNKAVSQFTALEYLS